MRAVLHDLLEDARHASRQIRRSPGFAAIAVATLGLGIGANASIFSVISGVLLQPLPYREPERLAVVLHHGTDPVSADNLIDWRAASRSFEGIGAAELWSTNLSGVDQPERLTAMRVTADLFPLLGVQPALGRMFRPDEEEAGRGQVVILSDAVWRRRFAHDSAIIGRTIRLNGAPYVVAGVMDPAFQFPPFWVDGVDVWAPLPLQERSGNRDGNSLRAFARLKPEVSIGSAAAEMAGITARLETTFPGTNRDVRVVALGERVAGGVRGALLVLFAAVGLVLLIACANVAHLLLARAADRHREMAVRMSLGAGRGMLLRQLLTESLVLASAGGLAGLGLAMAGLKALVAYGQHTLPRLAGIGIDGPVLAFTLMVSMATGVIFGVMPAWTASDVDVNASLKEGGDRGTTGGRRSNRLRDLLVASEFALAVVLLIAAGLAIRTFAAVRRLDPGFDPKGVVSLVVSVSGSEAGAPTRRAGFYRELMRQIAAIPGVDAAGGINHLPLAGDLWNFSFHVEGQPIARAGEEPTAVYRAVMPGYFETMRLPIVAGRGIGADDAAARPPVIVVNETLARRQWPGESPIGKRLTLGDPTNPEWLTVIGVVKDAVREGWTAAPAAETYVPILQSRLHLENPSPAFGYLTLVIRSHLTAPAVGTAVRQVVASLDRDVPVSDVQTMDQVVSAATAGSRFYLMILGVFAGLALVLASAGIYGVMSYTVTQRRQEIGIRMTLGAGRASILRLVLGRSLAVAMAGALVGVLAAALLTRFMATILYGVAPTDPFTFVTVPALLMTVAGLAAAIPAAKAARAAYH